MSILALFDILMLSTIFALTYVVASIFSPLLFHGAPYGVCKRKIIVESLKLVNLKRKDVFYDLGCGSGEVLIEASKLCENVRGIEMEPLRWFISKLRARKAKVVLGNLFNADISDGNVIFVYHSLKINNRIAQKIRAETQPGTKIISPCYPLRGMELIENHQRIFIYKV